MAVIVEEVEQVAEELGRRREREVRESSGRLPPNAKYWLPSDGNEAASACMLLLEGDHTNVMDMK